ncbi:GNAT family N-acetyltransferase [Microbulbifer variabilis]|uniref:GNAT family N-acetyltransferase n=1 Tax=Microbulbifer variabilis TaxID=266805 RepID=UPI0003806DCF|nr:GNAT family N-acetyltransferase [Microbulbifer variabilis]
MTLAQPSYRAQWLSDIEIPLANKFYRMHGFRGKARRYEDCAVVRDEREIVACGYLRRYDTFRLLAGVAVAREHQGRGVARSLLELLAEKSNRDTYTFPYTHLEPLYLSLGLERVNAEVLPEAVGQLYRSYLKQGRGILLMGYR